MTELIQQKNLLYFSDVNDNFSLKLTITFPYSSRICIIKPGRCDECPVGWQFNEEGEADCGRNKDWTKDGYQRPDTCKLRVISKPELEALILDSIKRI